MITSENWGLFATAMRSFDPKGGNVKELGTKTL